MNTKRRFTPEEYRTWQDKVLANIHKSDDYEPL